MIANKLSPDDIERVLVSAVELWSHTSDASDYLSGPQVEALDRATKAWEADMDGTLGNLPDLTLITPRTKEQP